METNKEFLTSAADLLLCLGGVLNKFTPDTPEEYAEQVTEVVKSFRSNHTDQELTTSLDAISYLCDILVAVAIQQNEAKRGTQVTIPEILNSLKELSAMMRK